MKKENGFINFWRNLFGNTQMEELNLTDSEELTEEERQAIIASAKVTSSLEKRYGGYDDVIKASTKLQRTTGESNLLKEADEYEKAMQRKNAHPKGKVKQHDDDELSR